MRCRQPSAVLDMAANQGALAEKISEQLKPAFTEYGLTWTPLWSKTFAADELQKVLDQRISMNVLGDMASSRNISAQAIPIRPRMKRRRSREWRRSRCGVAWARHDGCREEST